VNCPSGSDPPSLRWTWWFILAAGFDGRPIARTIWRRRRLGETANGCTASPAATPHSLNGLPGCQAEALSLSLFESRFSSSARPHPFCEVPIPFSSTARSFPVQPVRILSNSQNGIGHEQWNGSHVLPTQRTRIGTRLSRVNSSQYSIPSFFSEHLSPPKHALAHVRWAWATIRWWQLPDCHKTARFSSAGAVMSCSVRSVGSQLPGSFPEPA